MAATVQKPWYREPWPWILMSGPAAVIVGGFFTLALAFRTEDGLVADDYYKQGLAINQVLQRSERARELNLKAVASFSGSRVRVVLDGDAPAAVRLRLVHPTRAGRDQTAVLRASAQGVYEGALDATDDGVRRLELDDLGSSWRLTGTWIASQGQAVLTATQ